MNLKYPVKEIDVSQKFGTDNTNNPLRQNFYSIFDNKHPGIDFKVPAGTEIFAAYPGIVVRKEFNHPGMGKVVGIRNGNIVILYAHLSNIMVELGQKIITGEKIALSGESGKHCTHPHLHLETRDITKPTLKEMVFNPLFNQKIKQLKNKFYYIVYNENTQKTLNFLAQRYFGDKKYWIKIWGDNSHLSKKPNAHIEDGTKILIPNY